MSGAPGRTQRRPGDRSLFQPLEFPAVHACSDCSFHAGLDGIGTRAVRVFRRSRPGAPHLLQPGYARAANVLLQTYFRGFTAVDLLIWLQAISFVCLIYQYPAILTKFPTPPHGIVRSTNLN